MNSADDVYESNNNNGRISNGLHAENNHVQAVYLVPLESTRRLSSASGAASQRLLDYFIRPAESNEISSLIANRTMREKINHKFDMVLKNRSIIVDFLAIFFGIGTWIGINSTFIQLPLLVEELPEGWSLPSYLSVMVQIGNLGPLIYTLVQNFSKRKKNDSHIIYGLQAIGTISSLLTAFYYSRTAVVFGEEHSIALFILTVFTAINACTSSVLFMPYMGRFKEIYLVTYFIGEGLSGLLPSVVALIQGIGGTSECVLQNVTEAGEEIFEKYTPPPRFGTMEFFLFVFAMMVCSCIGFTLLDRLELSRKQYAAVKVSHGNNYVYAREDELSVVEPGHAETSDLAPEISLAQYKFLLLLITVISFFSNGIFNSIQSYSSLPYGAQAYHLSATLSVIANPVACFLAMFLPHTSLRSILSLSATAGVLTVYVVVTAAMSPLPPLHGTTVGAVLVISIWTVLIGIVSYTKLCITAVMRAQGGKSLVWTGGLTQLGSLFGSVFIFILINYTNSFQQSYDEGC